MAWLRASRPVETVTLGGIPTVRAGSTTAMRGTIKSEVRQYFTWVSLSEMTAYLETSDPVPEVVGTATMGRTFSMGS